MNMIIQSHTLFSEPIGENEPKPEEFFPSESDRKYTIAMLFVVSWGKGVKKKKKVSFVIIIIVRLRSPR